MTLSQKDSRVKMAAARNTLESLWRPPKHSGVCLVTVKRTLESVQIDSVYAKRTLAQGSIGYIEIINRQIEVKLKAKQYLKACRGRYVFFSAWLENSNSGGLKDIFGVYTWTYVFTGASITVSAVLVSLRLAMAVCSSAQKQTDSERDRDIEAQQTKNNGCPPDSFSAVCLPCSKLSLCSLTCCLGYLKSAPCNSWSSSESDLEKNPRTPLIRSGEKSQTRKAEG
ncbi:hypothetical protein PoB_001610000 [Plakobranchus ocellatus]|uniref:Uncharacterized protein n=1 Tax=Plakobranchus ocellatus TaxID=259542 RepID=A0AAV3Z350_9GAST|nr:hypothetical protein PoB_001610000 [Plakobranchus ocellatus]